MDGGDESQGGDGGKSGASQGAEQRTAGTTPEPSSQSVEPPLPGGVVQTPPPPPGSLGEPPAPSRKGGLRQAWAIVGYTLMHRWTGERDFLDVAVRTAD